MATNTFGPLFPPDDLKFRIVFSGGSVTGITTKQYILGTFTAPREGTYLVSMKGAITTASGMNNNNIHLIVSQDTTPSASNLDSFAFQSMPEWNSGTTILATSVCDTFVVSGTTPVSVYLYDTQAGGAENYDFTWSDVKIARISVYQ